MRSYSLFNYLGCLENKFVPMDSADKIELQMVAKNSFFLQRIENFSCNFVVNQCNLFRVLNFAPLLQYQEFGLKHLYVLADDRWCVAILSRQTKFIKKTKGRQRRNYASSCAGIMFFLFPPFLTFFFLLQAKNITKFSYWPNWETTLSNHLLSHLSLIYPLLASDRVTETYIMCIRLYNSN